MHIFSFTANSPYLRTLCVQKNAKDHKDMRGTKYTYCNNCFLKLLLVKSRLGTFPLLTICLLYLQI